MAHIDTKPSLFKYLRFANYSNIIEIKSLKKWSYSSPDLKENMKRSLDLFEMICYAYFWSLIFDITVEKQ